MRTTILKRLRGDNYVTQYSFGDGRWHDESFADDYKDAVWRTTVCALAMKRQYVQAMVRLIRRTSTKDQVVIDQWAIARAVQKHTD
jgi:hypothetical protein